MRAISPKTSGPSKIRAFEIIGFLADQNADQTTPLDQRLVRLVRSGPLWSVIQQVAENAKDNADQKWTKTGPRTSLVRSPLLFRAGGGEWSWTKTGPQETST